MDKEIKRIYKTMNLADKKQEKRLLEKEIKVLEKNIKNLKEHLEFLDI